MKARTLLLQIAAASHITPAFAGSRSPANLDSRGSGTLGSKPNVVFILTDDQDVHLDSLSYMPFVKKHLTDQGTTFKRHYCSTALCCPSRVTLWTGQLAHNTNVTDVSPPFGGYPKFVSQGYNDAYLPVWLEQAGYNSYYTGKLFNAHSVTTYNNPYPAGFKHTHFLLDPHTYDYLNATFQHDQDAPVSYAGNYSTDTLRAFGLELLDNAVSDGKPFFLTLAPIAPHSNLNPLDGTGGFTPPIPAARHAHLFPDIVVPRTENFNPETPSGASWVRSLPRQNQTVIDSNDEFYRNRLRALQALDELVDDVFARLEAYGLLENTYVVYSSDNGFHIGQHRLQPGKTCGYEEDINVPLIVRGPGVAAKRTSSVVTAHVDLAPTFLDLLGLPLRDDFDGTVIPFLAEALDEAEAKQLQQGYSEGTSAASQEHVTVEFWGTPIFEGQYEVDRGSTINTYKSVRVISQHYNLYYSVWCNNEHELYDMSTDPSQMNNLLLSNNTVGTATSSPETTLLGRPLSAVANRLDALLFVLKSCKAATCSRPWSALHPAGDVFALSDALDAKYDQFYEDQIKIRFNECRLGQILAAEGPQFEAVGDVFKRDGLPWDAWV